MTATKHTLSINLTIAFAVVWLLVNGFVKSQMLGAPYRDLILLISWLVPAVVLVVGLLPIGDPMKPSLQPCLVGNTPVPIFTMLPIALRSLLRITFRIVIVRTVIAVVIAMPYFWMLAELHKLEDVGGASMLLLLLIPILGAVWIISIPAFLANRLDPHLRRRKGIFPLILTTSLVLVPIGFLWIICGLAVVGLSFMWSLQNGFGDYAFLLLPAALGCLALSAVMSRLIFEILHLSLRERRYDWISKTR